jgi:hypothetical protein
MLGEELVKHCKYCQSQIEGTAKVCYRCGRDQRWFVNSFTNITVLVSIGLLIISFLQLNEARKERITAATASQDAKTALSSATSALTRAENAEQRAVKTTGHLQRLAVALTESRTKVAELEKEQQKTAMAQRDAANTLKQSIDYVYLVASYRRLNVPKCLAILRGRPKGTAEIWFKPWDEEALLFAVQIESTLKKAGWTVGAAGGIPQTEGANNKDILDQIPVGGRHPSDGVTIISKKVCVWRPMPEESAENCPLAETLSIGLLGVGGKLLSGTVPTLPDDHYIIVVGGKPIR